MLKSFLNFRLVKIPGYDHVQNLLYELIVVIMDVGRMKIKFSCKFNALNLNSNINIIHLDVRLILFYFKFKHFWRKLNVYNNNNISF